MHVLVTDTKNVRTPRCFIISPPFVIALDAQTAHHIFATSLPPTCIPPLISKKMMSLSITLPPPRVPKHMTTRPKAILSDYKTPSFPSLTPFILPDCATWHHPHLHHGVFIVLELFHIRHLLVADSEDVRGGPREHEAENESDLDDVASLGGVQASRLTREEAGVQRW